MPQKKPATPAPAVANGAPSTRPSKSSGKTARAKAASATRQKRGTIEDAIDLAVKSHRGQTDKYHLPYIVHVFGVAARCRTIEEKIVAFLHDVVEDGHATFDNLRRLGFSERIISAVDCLTRRKGETYEAFVDRLAPNPLARTVKLADLEDNMDVRRSDRAMKDKDAERMEKYRRAWQKLAAMVVSEA
jgi:(p)ppGpp synthase/HD superfamily hydrolase